MDLLPLVATRYPGFLAALEAMVNTDSGSYDAAGVNAIADRCEARFRTGGWESERLPGRDGFGDLVIGRRRGAGGPRVLLLAHMDTVFEKGTAAARPFTVDGDRAYGPGVCDDKAGLLAGFTAVETLVDAGWEDYGEIVFACTPDEEVGSPTSRPVVRALAADADVALCLECARANGDLVSARKGIVDVEIEVEGRAAHAGIEPEQGVNAALEAAHLTTRLQTLDGRWDGVTVNVGVIRAGTRPNVVAARATLQVDVRGVARASLDEAMAEVRRIVATPTVPGARATSRRLAEHPPMERAPEWLLDAARSAGAAVGIEVRDCLTGGAADANVVAAEGVPTLDGLGPVGGKDHADDEYLDLPTIVPRVALLAGLLVRLTAREEA